MDGTAFGALIKRKRGEKGWSQENLAEAIWDKSWRKGDISRIENAKVTPHERIIQKLCQALNISEAELAPIRMARPTAKQLDQIPTLSRDELELLATRFELERPYDRTDADLRQFLTLKAEEYRTYKAQIDGLDERVAAIGNLKGAAQDAAERLDFDTVEELLTRVTEVEAEIFAESCETRARNALLRGQVDQAALILTAGADALAVIDPLAPARRKSVPFLEILYDHGLRYVGRGLTFAVAMVEDALKTLTRDNDPQAWAKAQGNLAIALATLASRSDKGQAIALLTRAIEAYEEVLTVFTRVEYPEEWSAAQQNLAGALQTLAIRTDNERAKALLTRAIAGYEEALSVLTRAAHPVNWAGTLQNLAGALYNLATRSGGKKATALLTRAIAGYEEALTVRTRADHPADWAFTQENLAILHYKWSHHPTCTDPRAHLEKALPHVEAALTVYDPEHMSYFHTKATRMRDLILSALAAL